jgi:4-amino-4-deoxy-L-arabinose transferase-like glycosyltransferase
MHITGSPTFQILQDRSPRALLWRRRILVFFLPLFLALPFLGRSFFVDDSYFVQIASWLKDHPRLPYHFRADDDGFQTRGWEENGFVRMVNPLAHHYYLAALMRVGGEREWFLRLGCVFLWSFGALAIFELARRWLARPLLGTILVLVTPVAWMTSYSMLIDSTMGAFFLIALWAFIKAMESGRAAPLLLSGVAMGLSILSKYTALLILPLTATWLVLNWKSAKRPWRFALPWLIGLGFLLAYSVWTAHLYGAPHILAASNRMLQMNGWAKWTVLFVFLSGAAVAPLLLWVAVGPRASLVGALLAFVLAEVFASKVGGFTAVQAALLGVWAVTGAAILPAFLVQWRRWRFPTDHFLFLWLGGFLLMMIVVMNWVAVRYYVIAVPAIVFPVVRLVEFKWPSRAGRILAFAIAGTAVVTLALAYADYQQAGASSRLVRDLRASGLDKAAPGRRFYLGDAFTMSYLKKEGWSPTFRGLRFEKDDYIITSEVTMPLKWFITQPMKLEPLAEFNYKTRFPIKVMDGKGAAGFYASVWGALPFTISSGPWERFVLYRVAEVEAAPAPSAP